MIKINNKKKLITLLVLLSTFGLVGFMLIAIPFLPEISYRINKAQGFNLVQYKQTAKNELPKENRISIQTIGIDSPIIEGQSDNTVDRGVWRRPKSSDPTQGGNTVLVGHRFRYFKDAGSAFYNLNKVKNGDEIVVIWAQKLYTYQVTEIKVVGPEDITIELPTIEPRLTLYTCTPIWTNNQRLVLIAKLV